MRHLWVPQRNSRFQRRLGSPYHRRLGHPIGAPIRISFAQILRGSEFEPAKLRLQRVVHGRNIPAVEPLGKH